MFIKEEFTVYAFSWLLKFWFCVILYDRYDKTSISVMNMNKRRCWFKCQRDRKKASQIVKKTFRGKYTVFDN